MFKCLVFEFEAHTLQKGDQFTPDFGDNWWCVCAVCTNARGMVEVACVPVDGTDRVTLEFERDTMMIVTC